ncbi:MAG: hypothetical protein H7A51_04365 [Akkermansiaceae bacterium]|nr:hypothetical protein [Akkermansiaceae bacterium]
MKQESSSTSKQHTESAWTIATRVIKAISKFAAFVGIPLFVIGLIIYCLAVYFVHREITDKAVSITQAAGTSAEFMDFFGDFLPWLFTFALVPLVLRFILDCINPFGDSSQNLKKLSYAALILIALASLIPLLRTIRGVDADGLPVRMERSDPATAQWFAPNGSAVIFVSRESDGSQAFWNRPGTTPQTATISKPVTRADRQEWEAAEKKKKQQAEKKAAERKKEEEAQREAREEKNHLAREQALQKTLIEERQRHELERKRLEEEKARLKHLQASPKNYPAPGTNRPVITRPSQAGPSTARVSPPAAPRSAPLYRGKIFRCTVNGRSTVVWTDGPVSAWADRGAPRRLSAGQRITFHRCQVIYVRPLAPSAQRVYYASAHGSQQDGNAALERAVQEQLNR